MNTNYRTFISVASGLFLFSTSLLIFDDLYTRHILSILFFIGSGVYLFYYAWAGLEKGSNSYYWPSEQGRILKSEIKHFKKPSILRKITHYLPVVVYEYTIDDKVYRGNRITIYAMDHSLKNKNEAESIILNQYPVGSVVQVNYNPFNHGYSILKPGISDYRRKYLVTEAVSGSTLLVIGAWLLLIL